MSTITLSLRIFSLTLLAFCMMQSSVYGMEAAAEDDANLAVVKGPHRGRMLVEGDFSLELSIFETGVPPEFRAWIRDKQQAVSPRNVTLNVTLTRLGGVNDEIAFVAQDDFLRGQMEIYEPHSFAVTINAEYQGRNYQWQYDNFEGRTAIEAEVAMTMSIETEIAGSAELIDTIESYGRLTPHPELTRNVSARFDGEIKKVHVVLGQRVKKGDPLVVIESNESLKPYTIQSPLNGIISEKTANSGEQSKGRVLLRIIDTEILSAQLSIFPLDRNRIKVGAKVILKTDQEDAKPIHAQISRLDYALQENQAVTAYVDISNDQGSLKSGQFVTAEIQVERYQVPLAVKRVGLQSFRDFTVVYAKIGNEYEVRMLTLGRADREWVEVLGGLSSGTEYVTNNSFIIKADIEKSGASHDH